MPQNRGIFIHNTLLIANMSMQNCIVLKINREMTIRLNTISNKLIFTKKTEGII